MSSYEYLISEVKAVWKGELVDCSLLISGNQLIFGKETPLRSKPTKLDRREIQGRGGLVMPMLRDGLSFIPVSSFESDLRRLKDLMFQGGIGGGLIVPDNETSRVKWLDIGRRIRRVFGLNWRYGGTEANIRRWAQLRRELPPMVAVDSVQSLLSKGEQLRLCQAQDTRGIDHRHMFTPFSYSRAVIPLLVDEQRGNETLMETISRHYNEIEEIEASAVAEEQGQPLLGTTFDHGSDRALPFLSSLFFDKKSPPQKPNVIPVRDPKLRFQLLSNLSKHKKIQICVGNGVETDEIIDVGVPLAHAALPLLVDALKPFLSWVSIWSKLGGSDKITSFSILQKSSLEDIRQLILPFGIDPPKFTVSYSFFHGDLVYSNP